MKRFNSILFVLCLLLFSLFPFGVLIRIRIFPNAYVYPQDIVAGFIFVILVGCFLFKKKIAQFTRLLIAIAIFNIAAIISLVVNMHALEVNESFVALSYLIRFDVYASLLFLGLVNFSKKQLSLMRRFFIATTFLTVVLGYIQYTFYGNLRNLYYLGWDEHLYRLFSVFLDPNFAGTLFTLLALVLLGAFLKTEKRRSSAYYLFLFLLTIFAIVLTHSRTALLMLVVGLVFILIKMKKVKLLVLLILSIGFVALLMSDFSMEGLNPLRIASVEARIASMKEAIEIFFKSPIFGVGFNAYRYALIRFGFRTGEESIVNHADSGTDNSFLFILATTGIIGFLAYINIWRNIIKIILENRDFVKKTVSVAVIVSLFVGSFYINALFYAQIMIWIFFYLGMFVFIESGLSQRDK